MNPRQMRGFDLAQNARITPTERGWIVPSQSGKGTYNVKKLGTTLTCNCKDCEIRGVKCKHQWAAEYFVKKEKDENGNVTVTQVKKTTYPQNWKAYNKSQTSEIKMFDVLLKDLVEGIDEPEQRTGRPRLSLREQAFCAIQKVYSGLSSRRAYTLYKNAEGRYQIGKTPNFNAINKFLNREDITPILQELLTISALPLKGVETTFAPDSSGFRTSQFNEYAKHKYRTSKVHQWIKANILVGVKTNVIASARITNNNSSDNPHFEPLVMEAHDSGFNIREVVADMGYSSRGNYDLTEDIGAKTYIPFKKNATSKGRGSFIWGKAYHYFQLNREEFMEHYHQRSNVETAFMMIKTKLGDKLKSKKWVAQKNELLCKFIAHNIIVLIHEMNELGIEPDFSNRLN